jgi:hypothetical protein
LLAGVSAARAVPASAAATSLAAGDQAIVNVFVKGPGNDVEIRTSDRPAIEVESSDPSMTVDERTAAFGAAGGQPLTQTIGPMIVRTPEGTRTLVPPEEFPLANLRPGAHNVVRLVAAPGSRLVVTVPASIGLLRMVVGGGTTTIEGYRGANLLVVQGNGRLRIANASTTAFVQMGTGRLEAIDTTFERVRFRSNAANAIFERCRTKQIETTTIRGSVAYDGGSFDPGLARFESQSGNIALGVAGAAQLSGRSQNGHVFTAFEQRTAVQQQGAGAATATVAGGGPLVNALSVNGNVYLYDGSLRGRRNVPPAFRRLHQALERRAAARP